MGEMVKTKIHYTNTPPYVNTVFFNAKYIICPIHSLGRNSYSKEQFESSSKSEPEQIRIFKLWPEII